MFTVNQAVQDVKSAIAILTSKKLTDKQLIYTYNVVIIPRVEYRTQLVHLSENTSDRIAKPFRSFLKKKLHLPRDTPSCLLYSKLFYGITHLHHRHTQALCDAILYSVNDSGLLGQTTHIRLQQIQLQEWLPSSPLREWPFNNPKHFRDWIPGLLCDIKKLNIKIIPPEHIHKRILGGSTSIQSIIPNSYRKLSSVLAKMSIMFVE
jgi:hypothetical protein